MPERLADIITQIQNVRQLDAVVTAIRGIAASRAQNARSLLAGIEAYTDVISRAISQALALLPSDMIVARQPGPTKHALILFSAEQGFAGAFNERVLDAAAPDLDNATVFMIGTRGTTIAHERGIEPAWSTSMVGHVEAVPSFANRLAEALYDYLASGAVTHVDILFSRSDAGAGTHVERHSLLPVDFERFGRPQQNLPPLISTAPEALLESLAAEYVYAQLCEAAMQAFVAENEARMLAMLAARNNIETKLDLLTRRERQLRQEEITTEVVELAAGAEASLANYR